MKTVKMQRTVSMTHLERALDEVVKMEKVARGERKQMMGLKKFIKEELRKAQKGNK